MTQIAKNLSGENPSLNPPSVPNNFLEWLEDRREEKPFSKEQLELLRKEYKRLYHKAYYYKRKKNNYQLVVRLSKDEHSLFKEYAGIHNKSMNKFIKEVALAYLNNSYVPRDVKQIASIENEVRSVGNNINQVVRRIHRLKYDQSTLDAKSEIKAIGKLYETMLSYVEKIEKQAREKFKSTPSTLQEGLLEYIQLRPEKMDELIQFLEKNKIKNKKKF